MVAYYCSAQCKDFWTKMTPYTIKAPWLTVFPKETIHSSHKSTNHVMTVSTKHTIHHVQSQNHIMTVSQNTQYTALKKQYPIRYNKSSQNSIRIFTACYKTQYKQPRYSHNLDAKYSHFAWMIWPSINRTGLHQGRLQTDFYQETY